MNNPTQNKKINSITPLLAPNVILEELPSSPEIINQINASRLQIEHILSKKIQQLLLIVGPCSIHCPKAALDYAVKLQKLAEKHKDKLTILMRVYFEKPRTTLGWKGLINDPYLDNSHDINQGLFIARRLLLDINRIGLGVATEFVDTFTPQYLADLVSWAAIGARTTESQMHRMLASGLSMPVGFKNNTAGNIQAAINAVLAMANPHRFLGITNNGSAAIVSTTGNKQGHIILRGGTSGPNYHAKDVQQATHLLKEKNLQPSLMIDCSHDNSNKDYKKQKIVINNLCTQLKNTPHSIMGLMIESNLREGKQSLSIASKLNYGQSITDGCIGWEETEQLITQIANCY